MASSDTSLVERLSEQKKDLKDKLTETKGELSLVKTMFDKVLTEKSAPPTLLVEDIGGALLGIAAYRGGAWLYKKAGEVPVGTPPGFLQRNAWLHDLVQGGAGALTYAANLALPYDAPLSVEREIVRRMAVTQFTLALDAGLGKLWTVLTAPKPPAAPPATPTTAPAPTTPAKK